MAEEKTLNPLITFQCSTKLNENLRDAAWREKKTLSQLIRELCVNGLKARASVSAPMTK